MPTLAFRPSAPRFTISRTVVTDLRPLMWASEHRVVHFDDVARRYVIPRNRRFDRNA